MSSATASTEWPDESREAAQIVIDTYAEPDEMTPTHLVWHHVGPWKRVVATKSFFGHSFPSDHIDAVESFIDYRVPPENFSAIAEFDGSIMIERTSGEVSARCHDEQANFLALNLMHDIVTGSKTVQEAREYYAKEFLDARREQPTPSWKASGSTPRNRLPTQTEPRCRTISSRRLHAKHLNTERDSRAQNGVIGFRLGHRVIVHNPKTRWRSTRVDDRSSAHRFKPANGVRAPRWQSISQQHPHTIIPQHHPRRTAWLPPSKT